MQFSELGYELVKDMVRANDKRFYGYIAFVVFLPIFNCYLSLDPIAKIPAVFFGCFPAWLLSAQVAKAKRDIKKERGEYIDRVSVAGLVLTNDLFKEMRRYKFDEEYPGFQLERLGERTEGITDYHMSRWFELNYRGGDRQDVYLAFLNECMGGEGDRFISELGIYTYCDKRNDY